MQLSMKWLKDYLPLDVSPREFAQGMTMAGSKVEGYRYENEGISRVVVGEILKISSHPNADKLVICEVNVGEKTPLQIITGATNVVEGAKVPVCLDGARLPDGKEIHTGKLRGEKSEGMLCSLGELGLTAHDFPYACEDGIFLIEEDCRVGQEIGEAIGLSDLCVDFEITSNRPDCLSVIGLAREAAAWFNLPLTIKPPSVNGNKEENIQNRVQVEVQAPGLCRRYMAKMITDVTVKESPRWMRERLRASGVRPINNIVDITNYVMLAYGQPMHAFDLRCIAGGTIVVRQTQGIETMVTLDGEEQQLPDQTLVIADREKPVGIAGVMGGKGSGITGDTQTVLFESACFDGAAVRRASKAIGLRTESSSRFEKGLHPQMCEEPLLFACELVEKLGAGKVADGVIDIENEKSEPETIPFSPEWISSFLGMDIPEEKMVSSLQKLGFSVRNGEVTVPFFRVDVHHKADIAEEVARMEGYEKMPTTIIEGVAASVSSPFEAFQKTSRGILRSLGLSETIHYSFCGKKAFDQLLFAPDDERRHALKLQNPFGEDSSLMRTTTFFHMLKTLSRNYNNRNEKGWFYEMGRVYIPKEGTLLPKEDERITIGLYGDGCDFYLLKGMIESYCKGLHISDISFSSAQEMPFHPGRCAKVKAGEECMGILGEVHPIVAKNFGMSGQRVYLASLSAEQMMNCREDNIAYRALPKYPANHRDLSLVCPKDLPAASLMDAIQRGAGDILVELTVFDVYYGQQVQEGMKSLSFSLKMQADDHTLTDQEADEAVKRAIRQANTLGADLRLQ